MGTRAYWFRFPWRYRTFDADGDPGSWVYAETLRDVRSDTASGRWRVQVQKRTGRKSEGYTYVTHSITPPVCRCMTEDPGDGYGERVVTHSLTCHEHPEHEES